MKKQTMKYMITIPNKILKIIKFKMKHIEYPLITAYFKSIRYFTALPIYKKKRKSFLKKPSKILHLLTFF